MGSREGRSPVSLTNWYQVLVSVTQALREASRGGPEDRAGWWGWSRDWGVFCGLFWFSMQGARKRPCKQEYDLE